MALSRATRVEPRGIGPLPAPQATHLDVLSHPVHHGSRVRVQGIVTSTSRIDHPPGHQPEMLVVLGTPASSVILLVQGRAHDAEVASWVGTPALATGVAVPVANPRGQLLGTMLLVTPNDSLVPTPTVPGARQEWPLFQIQDLLRPGNASADLMPVRIQGTVTAILSTFLAFIQDDASGILVGFAPVPAQLKLGDQITAEGFPKVENLPALAPGLESAPVVFTCYRSWTNASQGLPAGIPVASNFLRHSRLNFRRITTEGRVPAVVRQGASDDFRIALQCGETVLDVLGTLPSSTRPLPKSGSVVRVTGVLDQRAQPDKPDGPIRLHLADAQDLVEIAPPRRDTTRDLAMAAVPASALALLAFGWAFALRRAVARRTSELDKANHSLALANRARADFLAHMSHEVRTPVHAMNGLLQLLGRLPLADQPRALVQRLAAASRSLTHLVNDALDLSKIDAGQLVLDPQPFHPNALLDHLDGLFAPLAQDKGLAWSVQRLPAHAPRLVGDAHRLQQVLANLASNAIKFTRHGHVRLLASLAPTSPTRPNGIQALSITCEDSGVGIAPETLHRLFQPYSQADASIQRTHGGTGLGLAIARRLVHLMGGSLHADSQPGVGSRFHLLVPLPLHATEVPHLAQDSPRPPLPTPPLPRAHRLSGRRILVADDHPTNLGIVEAALEQEDACALLVPDGLAALHAIESDPSGFDAVVIDLEMPVMDGLEAMRRVRRIPGCDRVPIIACSAGIRAAQREAALAAGATSFLPKPFDLEDLVANLAQLLPPDAPDTPDMSRPSPLLPTPTPLADATAIPHPFPSIEGIDARDAARRFAGNLPDFLHALGRFHASLGGCVAALRHEVETGRRDAVLARLHGLAGTASMVGAMDVATLAADMDQRLRHDPRRPMPPWEEFTSLQDALARLLHAVQWHLAPSKPNELPLPHATKAAPAPPTPLPETPVATNAPPG